MKVPATCLAMALTALAAVDVRAQSIVPEPDWSAVEAETLRHFLAILRLDTQNPPGNELLVVDYLKGVLDREGIPARYSRTTRSARNLVARLQGQRHANARCS